MWFYDKIKELKDLYQNITISISNFNKYKREIDNMEHYWNEKIRNLQKEREELLIIKKEFSDFEPWLSKAIADYYWLQDKKKSDYLRYKNHPAKKSSSLVKEIGKEKRDVILQLKNAEYKIQYYESLFPYITEYLDIDDNEVDRILNNNETEQIDNDEVLQYISLVDYRKMTPSERNQLALDRYLKKDHSKQHIGKMYERYIGYLYEMRGYSVEYKGIFSGFDDLGRDLIATKGNMILIIQCKCWSKDKEIKEAHINQLCGTKIKYIMDLKNSYRQSNQKEISFQYNSENYHDGLLADTIVVNGNVIYVKAIMITSTTLSETAKDFSRTLGIHFIENVPLSKEYPMIKCNINGKEKIYHLPFDQQYDRTKIDRKNERYVNTVKEAEDAGFRRARKWITNDISN